MNPAPKTGNLSEEELQKYLDSGGTITKCPPGERTENIEFKGGFYGKKKKKDGTE